MFYRQNVDDRVRRLERAAAQGDEDAMNQLYDWRLKTGETPRSAANELFAHKAGAGRVADPTMELFARLGLQAAIDIVPARQRRGPISNKSLKEMGQVAAMKLCSAALLVTFDACFALFSMEKVFDWGRQRTSAHTALVARTGEVPHLDVEDMERDFHLAIQELRDWKPGTKPNKKLMKMIDEGYDLIGDTFERTTFMLVLEGLGVAYDGRMTRKTGTGHTNAAHELLETLSVVWQELIDHSDYSERINCETSLQCLGDRIIPLLAEDLLLTEVRRIPQLDPTDPNYYAQEITARRFTNIRFRTPTDDDDVYLPAFILWTPNEEDAVQRAILVAEQMGWDIDPDRYHTNQDISHARTLLEEGYTEHEIVKKGFTPRLSKAEIKDRDRVKYIFVSFRGGRKETLTRVNQSKKLPRKYARKAQHDVKCFTDRLLSMGLAPYPDSFDPFKRSGQLGFFEDLEMELSALALNASNYFLVVVPMKENDERWELIFEAAKDCNGEARPSIRRRSSLRRNAEPSRNEPCPCGSGKNYKRCCLIKAIRPSRRQAGEEPITGAATRPVAGELALFCIHSELKGEYDPAVGRPLDLLLMGRALKNKHYLWSRFMIGMPSGGQKEANWIVMCNACHRAEELAGTFDGTRPPDVPLAVQIGGSVIWPKESAHIQPLLGSTDDDPTQEDSSRKLIRRRSSLRRNPGLVRRYARHNPCENCGGCTDH